MMYAYGFELIYVSIVIFFVFKQNTAYEIRISDWSSDVGSSDLSAQLERCLEANIGDLTFAEAFNRTHRIVSITVSPAEAHQQGRLLNYLTAPHVLLRKAVLASCAVPGIFAPVQLEDEIGRAHV